MASFGVQYFGVDFSAFPTQRPTLNFVLLAVTFFFVLVILRQLLKGLVFWVKQEHAFWRVPVDPVASFLYGHGPMVRSFVYILCIDGVKIAMPRAVPRRNIVCVTADQGVLLYSIIDSYDSIKPLARAVTMICNSIFPVDGFWQRHAVAVSMFCKAS